MPGYCVFGVQGTADSTFNMYILGDIFLNSFYSIYDYDNKRVGIALHIQSSATVEMERNHWIFPIIVISLVVIGLSIGFYFWRRRRIQREVERKNVQYYS